MGTRAKELRRTQNRILLLSLFIAAVLHAAIFLLWPKLTVEPYRPVETHLAPPGESGGATAIVDVTFGPSEILERGGGYHLEPPEHVLETGRTLGLPKGCEGLLDSERTPVGGRVRLQVLASGHTLVNGIDGSTGDHCADRVILGLAADLLYHWLPSERFPAPVELIQPVTLLRASALQIM